VSITPLFLEALSGAKLLLSTTIWVGAGNSRLKRTPVSSSRRRTAPRPPRAHQRAARTHHAASERLLDQGVGIGVGAGSLEKISRDAGIDAIRLNHDGIPMKSGAPASLAGAPSGGLEYSQVCGEADQAASACRLDAKAEKERFGKTRG
jgi:hypothetical protein